jgi:hypothetical protein
VKRVAKRAALHDAYAATLERDLKNAVVEKIRLEREVAEVRGQGQDRDRGGKGQDRRGGEGRRDEGDFGKGRRPPDGGDSASATGNLAAFPIAS